MRLLQQLFCFNAFHADVHLQLMRTVHNRFDNNTVHLMLNNAARKALVQLNRIKGQITQQHQRSMACTKIVRRNTDAMRMENSHQLFQTADVERAAMLRKFQKQIFRREAALRQNIHNIIREAVALQLLIRNIDAQAEIGMLTQKLRALAQCPAQNPQAKVIEINIALKLRNIFQRRHHAPRHILITQKRLRADNPALRISLRLILQVKAFAVVQHARLHITQNGKAAFCTLVIFLIDIDKLAVIFIFGHTDIIIQL